MTYERYRLCIALSCVNQLSRLSTTIQAIPLYTIQYHRLLNKTSSSFVASWAASGCSGSAQSLYYVHTVIKHYCTELYIDKAVPSTVNQSWLVLAIDVISAKVLLVLAELFT